MTLAAAELALGLPATLVPARFVESFLFGIARHDAASFGIAAATLLAAAAGVEVGVGARCWDLTNSI